MRKVSTMGARFLESVVLKSFTEGELVFHVTDPCGSSPYSVKYQREGCIHHMMKQHKS